MLLEVRRSLLKEQEKPFSIWTWWIVNLMQGCNGSERRGRKGGGGLTQGFEKFIKILAPLHLPGAGKVRHVCWGWVRGRLKEPVPRCDASLPLCPLWLFLTLLLLLACAPVSSARGSRCHTQVYFSPAFLCIFLSLHTLAFSVCLSELAAILCPAPL